MSQISQVISENVVKNFVSQYDLNDEEVITALKSMIVTELSKYTLSSAPTSAAPAAEGKKKRSAKGSESAPAKEDKPRKQSGYNIFVKEMMAREDVKAVPTKERMGHVSQLWKALDEAGKKVYNDKSAATEVQASA